MKIQIKGWIHASANYDASEIEYHFWRWDQMDGEQMVCAHTIEFDVVPPDPKALAIAVLLEEKVAATKAFVEKTAEINQRLANLQALTNNPSEPEL